MVKAAALYRLMVEAAQHLEPDRRLRVWQEGLQRSSGGPVTVKLLPRWLSPFGLGPEGAWQGSLPKGPQLTAEGWVLPLVTPRVALGVLSLPSGRLTLAANLCALSLGEAAEQAELRQRQLGAERQRLAADLHDGFAQILYLLRIELELSRRGLAQAEGAAEWASPWVERLASTERLAALALADLRQQIRQLRQGSDLGAGWLANLLDLAARYDKLNGVRVQVEVAPALREIVPGAVGETLYRVAQEATHNALKHAGARNISVRLAEQAGGVRLEVIDDGCGMGAQALPGLGLQVMAERAAAIAGTLEVIGGPAGTLVSLFWGEGGDGDHQALAD